MLQAMCKILVPLCISNTFALYIFMFRFVYGFVAVPFVLVDCTSQFKCLLPCPAPGTSYQLVSSQLPIHPSLLCFVLLELAPVNTVCNMYLLFLLQ